jgi:hypothetical protein
MTNQQRLEIWWRWKNKAKVREKMKEIEKWIWNTMEENGFESYNKKIYYILWTQLQRLFPGALWHLNVWQTLAKSLIWNYKEWESNFEIQNSNKKNKKECEIIKSDKMWSAENHPNIIIVVWNVVLNKAKIKKELGG